MTPAALTLRQACAYLNVSRSHFYRHVRPYIKGANIARPDATKPMMRWTTKELDRFLADRMK